MKNRKYKIILSGGGTGGHIYPAVAVAEALERKLGDDVEILFVGAEGRMEMEKVPALGYKIEGLPVAGLQRRFAASNLKLPFKIMKSLRRAKNIIRNFGADVVVGFGGYASGPVLWSAQRIGVPTLIQEQNSHAGLTNRILGRRAKSVCVAYEGMQKYFRPDCIVHTGNPLRGSFSSLTGKKSEALEYFGLDNSLPVILVVGGSLGTRTLNEAVKKYLEKNPKHDFQLIWQTGKYYYEQINKYMENLPNEGIWFGAFIERMDLAYSAADVVISRSGAGTVSELSLSGKATIFVPSPNVTEDHQTKNAMALVSKDAALMVPDSDAVEKIFTEAEKLLSDTARLETLEKNISALAIPDSADRIAQRIIELADSKRI